MIDAARRDFTTLRNLPADEFFADSFTYAAEAERAADHPPSSSRKASSAWWRGAHSPRRVGLGVRASRPAPWRTPVIVERQARFVVRLRLPHSCERSQNRASAYSSVASWLGGEPTFGGLELPRRVRYPDRRTAPPGPGPSRARGSCPGFPPLDHRHPAPDSCRVAERATSDARGPSRTAASSNRAGRRCVRKPAQCVRSALARTMSPCACIQTLRSTSPQRSAGIPPVAAASSARNSIERRRGRTGWRLSSSKLASASPACPCSSAISASSISRGTARWPAGASGRARTRCGRRNRASPAPRGTDQRGKPRRARHFERLVGKPPRLAVAALEQRNVVPILLRAHLAVLRVVVVLGHVARQRSDRAASRRTPYTARIGAASDTNAFSDSSTRYGGATNKRNRCRRANSATPTAAAVSTRNSSSARIAGATGELRAAGLSGTRGVVALCVARSVCTASWPGAARHLAGHHDGRELNSVAISVCTGSRACEVSTDRRLGRLHVGLERGVVCASSAILADSNRSGRFRVGSIAVTAINGAGEHGRWADPHQALDIVRHVRSNCSHVGMAVGPPAPVPRTGSRSSRASGSVSTVVIAWSRRAVIPAMSTNGTRLQPVHVVGERTAQR